MMQYMVYSTHFNVVVGRFLTKANALDYIKTAVHNTLKTEALYLLQVHEVIPGLVEQFIDDGLDEE